MGIGFPSYQDVDSIIEGYPNKSKWLLIVTVIDLQRIYLHPAIRGFPPTIEKVDTVVLRTYPFTSIESVCNIHQIYYTKSASQTNSYVTLSNCLASSFLHIPRNYINYLTSALED